MSEQFKCEQFKVRAVTADDAEIAIDAKRLTINLGDNELTCWVHNWDGENWLTLISDDASFTLQPSACNGMRLSLKRFKHHATTAYELLTDRARKIMKLANEEAMRLNHEYIGTEHVLIALIREGSGVAAHVLKNLGLDLDKIRIATEKIAPGGSGSVPPSAHRSKTILDHSIEEARNLNHHYVGSEHILLGVLREPDAAAVQVITQLGLSPDEVRREVLALLGHAQS